ncbi:MAG: SDR family oxidoreductase [Saprospiraceae bacterium]|nr:SDR family oxidoreductase [Saprospiraceae bacterium]
MPLKVLITGSSGFLGWNFCKKFQNVYNLVGTYFRHQPKDLNIDLVHINLIETPLISDLILQSKPDVVIHLAAIANSAYCEDHPALSHHVNVYATLALAKATALQKIPMIFASTDLVFNGNAAPYKEDDFCFPLSQYGIQKQMAEESLLTDFEHVIIARFPLMFGFTPIYTHNFFSSSLQKLQEADSINAFTDEFRSMISSEVAGQWIQRLIEYSLSTKPGDRERIFHVGGVDYLSRYDFAMKMAEVFKLDTNLIIPTLQKDLNLIPQRPEDVCLNSSLAISVLGYTPIDIDEQLNYLYLSIQESS